MKRAPSPAGSGPFNLAREVAILCRRVPLLDTLVRPPMRFLWDRVWNLVFWLRGLFADSVCQLTVHGYELFVDTNDRGISRQLYWFKTYEPEETAMAGVVVREGMTVLDLGANIGYYTLLFSRLVGARGRVLAVEPSPYNFALLTRSVEANSAANVTAVQQAVADSAGELQLALSTVSLGQHRMTRPGAEPHFEGGSIAVKSGTVDDLMEVHGLSPDFIKMDIEGAEYVALQGMVRTLSASEEILIMCEFNPLTLHSCGASAEEFVGFLNQLDFGFFAILGGCRTRRVSAEELLAGAPSGKHFNLLLSRRDLLSADWAQA